eukprot:TRINITY_DN597_c0_g2_i13.p1 TRINITY_DN597_c0_g2~~TRINITY_DN597_c0_g2_i13.p1  ORF type:complete len:279 (+),score=40.87 TRINITY_DN597_c0_g2_i13:575-1411(+)
MISYRSLKHLLLGHSLCTEVLNTMWRVRLRPTERFVSCHFLMFQLVPRLRPMIKDTVVYLNTALKEGKKILIESANAVMLDVDFGTYPYVTSSSPSIGGAGTGLGIPPRVIASCIGIVKAYSTRVGEGPFVSEDEGEHGTKMREIGHEVGTTTGRARRCGWLDIPQLRYSTMINGYDQLCMTKSDVLDSFEEIKVVTAYSCDGEVLTSVPASLSKLTKCSPVYKTFPGWKTDTTKARSYEELPENLKSYIKWIEEQLNVPFTCISVGPGREETLYKPK